MILKKHHAPDKKSVSLAVENARRTHESKGATLCLRSSVELVSPGIIVTHFHYYFGPVAVT